MASAAAAPKTVDQNLYSRQLGVYGQCVALLIPCVLPRGR